MRLRDFFFLLLAVAWFSLFVWEDRWTRVGDLHWPAVYWPRLITGRLGNRLFEYFFWRLLAADHGVPFLSWRSFPPPFDSLSRFSWTSQSAGLEEFNWKPLPPYAMDTHLYWRNRERMRSWLPLPEPPEGGAVVTVHVRLEDIFRPHALYSLLPLRFYKRVFRRLPVPPEKIVVIGYPHWGGDDAILQRVFNQTVEYIRGLVSCEVLQLETGSVTKDTEIILRETDYLIGSTSAFWYWPWFLSRRVKEIHVPAWGQVLAFNFCSLPGVVCYELSEEKMPINEKNHLWKMYT